MSDERWPIGHPGVSDPDEDEKWVRAYEQQHDNTPYITIELDEEIPFASDVDDVDDVDVATLRERPNGCESVGWSHFWRPVTLDPRFEMCDICRCARRKPA